MGAGYNYGILPPIRVRWLLCTTFFLTTLVLAQDPTSAPTSRSQSTKIETAQAPVSQISVAQSSVAQSSVPQFEDVAEKAGLTVSHISSTDKKYIVESMSGGVGLIDCDNDGKLDIITVNGSTVERYKRGGDLLITLYHQDVDSHGDQVKFTDITKAAGLTRKGWGMGIARGRL
jgi:hypothetical protein